MSERDVKVSLDDVHDRYCAVNGEVSFPCDCGVPMEIEALQKKLSAAFQRIDELQLAERLNVETVAALQKERDELRQDIARYRY